MTSVYEEVLHKIGKENTKFYQENRLEKLAAIACKGNLLGFNIPIIAVTGTNGKGSTIKALASIYQHAGFRAGVYTSPHLQCVNERIAINQTNISDEDLLLALNFVQNLDDTSSLSFFETMTLAALYYFQLQQVDVLLLEVGVGGRLDAINIVDADMVVMTSVDLDHQELLGDSRNAIAQEKAGLLRTDAELVFADYACPSSIFSIVASLGIPFQLLGRDYSIEVFESTWRIRIAEQHYEFLQLPQLHVQAMAGAIMVSYRLQDRLPVTLAAWQAANATAFMPGRLQRIEGNIPLILDVAHNPHAISLLYKHLAQQKISGRIHAVCSVLQDKDGDKIVEIINKLSPLWYTSILDSERSHTQQSLQDLFARQGLTPYMGNDPVDAFITANQRARPNDLIVVFGSFLMVGPVIQYLQKESVDVV